MPNAQLLERFRSCLRYKQARAWQKPLLNPRRFAANQLRKRGLLARGAGTLSSTATFFLPKFTTVEGELVSQEIVSYSLYEPELTEAFLRLVEPGQAVLDIGMHLGYYATLFAVLVGPEGEVHAFEPTPSTREIAKRNTSQFAHLHVHPFAVWSSAGVLQLRDYGLRWMGFNTLLAGKAEQEPAAATEVEVRTVTLDAFRATLSNHRKVSLIKIDAESAEREIIAGAQDLIRRDRPLISVEVGDREGVKQSRALAGDLIALDYLPWEFTGGRFQRHQTRQTYGYDNLVFAPASVNLESA